MTASHLVVEQSGLHTTVQDEGRWGAQHLGVPVGGALDLHSLHRANLLVGNRPGEAALEVTLTGCVLRATGDVHLAVTGARFALHVHADGEIGVRAQSVPMDRAFLLPAGARLAIGRRESGARAYVAVRGGIDTSVVLGSRSAWPLLTRRGALTDGTVLAVGTRAVAPVRTAAMPAPAVRDVLRVLPTYEGTRSADVLAALCETHGYRVGAGANRMAYLLEDGPTVRLVEPRRPPCGTVNGALQILPSGLPVLLMAERQTTGGYPAAAVVITADLPHAAQLAPGARVRFVPCTRDEARAALLTSTAGTR